MNTAATATPTLTAAEIVTHKATRMAFDFDGELIATAVDGQWLDTEGNVVIVVTLTPAR